MKNLLINFSALTFLFFQNSFSQNVTEINETISPIQNEEIIYKSNDLENDKNIINFIEEFENSNSEIINTISASDNYDGNEINEENVEYIEENEIQLENNENNEINAVLKELGNETALEDNIGKSNSENVDLIQSNMLSEVSSQKLDELSISSYGILRKNSLFNQDIWKSIDIVRAKELLKISKTIIHLNSY